MHKHPLFDALVGSHPSHRLKVPFHKPQMTHAGHPPRAGGGKTPTTGPKKRLPMQNPQTQYVRPPLAAKTQAWPGLDATLQPPADHGQHSYVGSQRLEGRKALITGGDSGIGRATAIAFAREGADVAINFLPEETEDANAVAALIQEAGRKAILIPGDLRQAAFCQKLITQTVQALGGLDILVNNAAHQIAQASILDISDEQLDSTFKTNLYAMFWLTRAAVPHLPPGSAIINTTSIVASAPPQHLLDYATTKAGIVTFTKCIAKQLAQKGIRVNAVAPGPFWTPLQVCGGTPEHLLPDFCAQTPLGRPGQPAEIASLYVLLASQESSYTTGSTFGSIGGAGDVG